MRVKTLELTWFRGASEPVALETGLKSVVIYGENGSGKSSFVDCMEYLLNNAKVGHLAHEYSGKHQEKGLVNTAMPAGLEAKIRAVLADASDVTVTIKTNGAPSQSGDAAKVLSTWAYHRTILRQDEVAAFIRDTKGGKYSSLLPLLGLHSLEFAAENLRQLAKAVEQTSGVRSSRETLKSVNGKRTVLFKDADDRAILDALDALYDKYGAGDRRQEDDPEKLCVRLGQAIAEKVTTLSSEQRRHLALQTVAQTTLVAHLAEVRAASIELAASAEPLIIEKLQVLAAAHDYVQRTPKGDIKCPACGQAVHAVSFASHVAAEKARLIDIAKTFERRKAAVANVCQCIAIMKTELARSELKPWWNQAVLGPLRPALQYLERLDIETIRRNSDEVAISEMEAHLVALVEASAAATVNAPIDIKDLADARDMADFGLAFLKARDTATMVARVTALLGFLATLEAGVRQEIRSQSKAVIDSISEDIRTMWAILHPGSQIEDTRLYYPDDVDKAIDVQLKFYGVLQESPRLTLSEGYRNSLGLCIFLAMAKREATSDRPVFLDDVVVSLDRNHRGMVVDLLEREFSDRQVILLTHDREWYTELRQQLDDSTWLFKTLWPYDRPATGIRWSSKSTTFDDARSQVDLAPEVAGNIARKIMDIELALLTERLRCRLPYLHGYKNDHRTGHDFITRLISDAPACFKKRGEKDHEPYADALESLKVAQKLLVSWGNRSSHTFDVTKQEALKLVAACEGVLKRFICSTCKKPVHKLNDTSGEFVQCQCGALRWRYGKA